MEYPSADVLQNRCALKNFANFTGKHVSESLFNKVAIVNIAKFLRTPFLQNNSGDTIPVDT